MSQKPENTFIASIHKLLPPTLYRMKNHNAYNGGIPDVWYSGVKADLWIEYKFLVLPKRDSTVIDLTAGKDPMLSALQQAWLRGRRAEGRNVGVIVGCKEGGVWFDHTSWKHPYTTAEYREWLLDRKSIASTIFEVTGGPP
jgi:hypothetical protein